MTETALTGLIIGLATVLSPLITIVLMSFMRRGEKAQEYARLDKVAADAAEQGRRLLERQDTLARISEGTKDIAEATHALVNSEKTEGLKRELGLNRQNYILLTNVAKLTKASGGQVDSAVETEINLAKAKIDELEPLVAERIKQDKAMAAKVKTAPVPVTDDRTAIAVEQLVDETRRVAVAAEDKKDK